MTTKINIIIISIALIIIIALACMNSCNNAENRNRLESANSVQKLVLDEIGGKHGLASYKNRA